MQLKDRFDGCLQAESSQRVDIAGDPTYSLVLFGSVGCLIQWVIVIRVRSIAVA